MQSKEVTLISLPSSAWLLFLRAEVTNKQGRQLFDSLQLADQIRVVSYVEAVGDRVSF